MAQLRRVPPGRAGQVWLEHRLAVAERGAELLDQKLRILHEESNRLALLTRRTGERWEQAQREADDWLLRASLLSGQSGIRLASSSAAAAVEVRWVQRMGVTYPTEGVVAIPDPSLNATAAANAALVLAGRAYAAAAEAAVQHAVAKAASEILSAEATATRHRLRSLTRRWIPRLQDLHKQAALALEEAEHEDVLRLRWGHTVGGSRKHGPDRPGWRSA